MEMFDVKATQYRELAKTMRDVMEDPLLTDDPPSEVEMINAWQSLTPKQKREFVYLSYLLNNNFLVFKGN